MCWIFHSLCIYITHKRQEKEREKEEKKRKDQEGDRRQEVAEQILQVVCRLVFVADLPWKEKHE